MASSPGRASGLQSGVNTGGQVTMAVNTPNVSTSAYMPEASSLSSIKGTTTTPCNLFDPTHIPTILPRIQTLSRLLIEASNTAASLSIPQELDSKGQLPPNTAALTGNANDGISGPNLALGAMDENDVNDGFEAGLSLSFGINEGQQNIKRTELAQSIVRESRRLREAFDRARSAIDSIEGGEMDVEEQERLTVLLRNHIGEQRRMLQTFQNSNVHMDET